MKEITTKNNATLKVGLADFESVMNLKSALQRAILESKTEIKLPNLKNVDDLLNGDLNIDSIARLFFAIDSNREFMNCLFACLARCTYNNAKITRDLFETNPKIMSDYYEIAFACIKENLSPLFGTLFSKLNSLGSDLVSQKQPSAPQS